MTEPVSLTAEGKTKPRDPDGFFYVLAQNHVEQFGTGHYDFKRFGSLESAFRVAQNMSEKNKAPFFVIESYYGMATLRLTVHPVV